MSLPEMERAMGWSKRWLLALWLGASGIMLTDARGQDRAPAVRLGAPITQAPVIVPAGASTVQRVQFQQAQPGANRSKHQGRSQEGEEEEPAAGVSIRCTLTLPTVNKASSSRQTPFVIYNTKLLLSALIKA